MRTRNLQDDDILSEINIIPFVDISLVLLIIFMVTANYILTSSFTVDLAQAAHAKAAAETTMVNISVSREGPIFLENQLVTLGELKRKMRIEYRDNPNLAVMLSVDKNANFKNVVGILDMLSDLGISRLNIAAASED